MSAPAAVSPPTITPADSHGSSKVAGAPATPRPGSGNSGLQTPAELIKEAEIIRSGASWIMDRTLRDYVAYADKVVESPVEVEEMQAEAQANLTQQNMLMIEAEKIRAEIAELKKQKTDSRELTELREELRKLEDIIENFTGVQFANELLLDAKRRTNPGQHALMMDDLRNRLDQIFSYRVGRTVGKETTQIISERKPSLLRAAKQATTAWENALDDAKRSGDKNLIKFFELKLHDAEKQYQKIQYPNYMGGGAG